MSVDSRWMKRTIELAARARGRTAPNPMVGAVIVRDGEVLAEGFHVACGEAHGEVAALEALGGASAAGATMYVNLEPCCHYGRTPPCTEAILDAGIARVIVGMVDPDPRMSGKGIEALRVAGVEVQTGIEEAACKQLNAAYLMAREHGRPLVTLKAGITLDGRIASAFGESQWITGPQARQAGHRLRDGHDAILVGRGTVEADDPALTTRVEGGRDPVRVVLDSNLSLAREAQVLQGAGCVVFAGEGASEGPEGADVVRVERTPEGLNLGAVLSELAERGIHSLLVEGGGKVHRSFLQAGLADRLELFVAPRILAGGPAWVADGGFHLEDAPEFSVVSTTQVGDDLHLVLERRHVQRHHS